MEPGAEASLSTLQRQELEGEIIRLNNELHAAGGASAEHAFGLGCWIGLLPLFIILLLLFFFKLINLILLFILLIMGVLALLGLAMLAAFQARGNAIQRVFGTSVNPEITRLMHEFNLARQEFDDLAYRVLAEDAPLQAFLHSTTSSAEENHPSGGNED